MIKLPKTVIIGGQTWKIQKNKKYSGGKFWGAKNLIEIGTECPHNITRAFLHEVLEAILMERDCRYDQYGGMDGNENYLFSFYHKDFIQIINDLELALRDVLK
jgi:hypothetical protein